MPMWLTMSGHRDCRINGATLYIVLLGEKFKLTNSLHDLIYGQLRQILRGANGEGWDKRRIDHGCIFVRQKKIYQFERQVVEVAHTDSKPRNVV
uniref:AlNc14C65G4645 protein n=1 Tax=Albugo laibachii Nc14 TaxID=890382 RepID=F0WDC5_9STRA|nr:AlNc14C65G4645 [Albugo laibachii Nc14]|eukprot:CCA19197.1 AlNc14C65G4645 [Albugo laibachii Nc14]